MHHFLGLLGLIMSVTALHTTAPTKPPMVQLPSQPQLKLNSTALGAWAWPPEGQAIELPSLTFVGLSWLRIVTYGASFAGPPWRISNALSDIMHQIAPVVRDPIGDQPVTFSSDGVTLHYFGIQPEDLQYTHLSAVALKFFDLTNQAGARAVEHAELLHEEWDGEERYVAAVVQLVIDL